MQKQITRRVFLEKSAISLTIGATVQELSATGHVFQTNTQALQDSSQQGFAHRGYLGWITDLASEPDTFAPWPSTRLDRRLLQDYRTSFATMRQLNFNEISIWGLYVARAWPVDVESALTKERGALVETLIDDAHRHGLRVYAGLGVYSWGFEEIIKAYPRLSRSSNRQAMCASEPESWKWMQRVVDFVFKRLAVDGVSMQSADQGRCSCEQCKVYSDAEYHALLNVRVADYVRSRWPSKIIGINSWGLKFQDPAALPSLVKMGQKVDYIIDVHDSSRQLDESYRRQVIQALDCDFGTLGGPQVEPPQHWARDRWFLPTLKRNGEHLQQLAADGGRACEYFFHIMANPGDEVSLRLAGKVLAEPGVAWEKHLEVAIEQVFGVSRRSTRDALAQLLLNAEEAYFKHLDPKLCGTISMEPLIGDQPGKPVYLIEKLNAAQRQAYQTDLQALKAEAQKLLPDVPQKAKMAMAIRGMTHVLKDLQELKTTKPRI